MNNFYFILIILVTSCNKSQPTPKTFLDNDSTVTVITQNTIKQVEDGFPNFINKFSNRELPLIMKMDSPEWIDFSRSQEGLKIDTKSVNFFINNNDTTKLYQPNGGKFEYYYGFKLISELTDFNLILYYRVGDDSTGYILATYDFHGSLISQYFFAGISGLYDIDSQIESTISNDLVIETITIEVLNKEPEQDSYRIYKSITRAKISKNGKILVESTSEPELGFYIFNPDHNFRLEPKN